MPVAMGDRELERLNEIKAVLRALLIANSKIDVTIPCLNGMFREEERENIPYTEFGYQSLLEFLRSMPDVVSLRYNKERQHCVYHVETEKSAHISSLVSRQKNPQKKAKFNVSYKPRNSYGNYNYNYYRPPSQSSTMSTLNSLRLVLEELRKAPKYYQSHKGIKKSAILQKLKERPGKSSISSINTLNTKLKELSQHLVVDEDFVYFKEDIVKSPVNTVSNSAHKPAKYAYQNLEVRSAPSQNSVPRPEANQQVNGFKSVISQPTPQFIQVERSCPTQTSQSQAQDDQNQEAGFADVRKGQKPCEIDSGNEMIKERVKFRLQKLIEKYPEGIWAAELPSIYLKEYNIELDYHELGFHNITEFVSAVPEILTITDPDVTGRHMIVNAKIPLDKTKSKEPTKSLASHYNFDDFIADDKEPVPNKLSLTTCQKLIPEGMMGFEDTVDHISVGSLAAKDYFEVNISEIFTPSFFWVTLRKNKSKIKKLMEDLDKFYKDQNLDECRLPPILNETGLNVACIYAKMWHRGIIKKVKPDGFAVIFFYDYGTVKTYNPYDLYYLHKKFSALPAQALACGLYNVKAPQGNEWPVPSTNMFVNKVWGVSLIATVCEKNENNNTMMITLTDTSNDTVDLHLNEWMIESGLAVRGKMENIPSGKYHVGTHGVPIDKLCMYDEDALRKRDDEYERSTTIKEQGGTQIGNGYTETVQADIKNVDSSSNYIGESSFDASNIAIATFRIVRENMDLTKQTNTITQAILSNIPINKQEVSSRSLEMPASVKTSENKSDPVSNSCSEDIKKISLDLNRNLNAIKDNFSDIVDNSCADLFKIGSAYLNQIDRTSNRESSVVSLSSLPSSFDYMQSTRHYSNELSDYRASNQSLYSHQSTTDFQSQSTRESNCQNKCDEEYDKLSFTDGTPTFYNVKHNDNSPKQNQIIIKYPSTFASTMIDQSIINNDAVLNNNILNEKSSCTRESDEGYQTTKFGFSTQTSNESSSTSFKSKSYSASYIPIELSERCSKKTVHIFHLDNQGWISVDEFIDCFTNLKLGRIMFKILETFNVNVNYKHLTRVDNSQLFSQLDQSRIKAPRESNGEIKTDFVLILLPLKEAMLHVLPKLDFVNPKTFKEATMLMKQLGTNAEDVLFKKFNSKVLYDALNLVIQYRKFRNSHTP